MATFSFLLQLFSILLALSGSLAIDVGINYGQIANNLPSPTRVLILLRSLNISRVKLYDADPNVLRAFANSNIEFILGVGVDDASDQAKAQTWIQQHVQPFLPQTKITCITVGNEVFDTQDTRLWTNLLPAMKNVHSALVNLGLDKQITVTTAHSFNILSKSYPPSAGQFRQDLAQYLQPILSFHSQIKSPLLINAYPFFAYKGSPGEVSLEYCLFQPNQGMVDPGTNLHYDNMLYAQIDSVYAAIKAMGHTDVEVKLSETGWPSKGEENEIGATVENAGTYHTNLLKRIQQREGTPAKPSDPIDIYVFALFNENLKPGPVSERNYGLFYPDGRPVYNIGVQGNLPDMTYTGSEFGSSTGVNIVAPVFSILILVMVRFFIFG